MPQNETLMASLKARYGDRRGEETYWSMAAEGKGPFGPGGKYRAEHEAIAAKAGGAPLPGKKKAPTRKAGAKRQQRR